MINQLQDAIMLTAGIVVLCAIVVGVVLLTMTVYFELADWVGNIKLRWVRRRNYVKAAQIRREDIAFKQAWDAYSASMPNATIGDRLEFYARMRELS